MINLHQQKKTERQYEIFKTNHLHIYCVVWFSSSNGNGTRHARTQNDHSGIGRQYDVSASEIVFAGGKINKSIELAKMSKSLTEDEKEDLKTEAGAAA